MTIENWLDMCAADMSLNTNIDIDAAFGDLAGARQTYASVHESADTARQALADRCEQRILDAINSGVPIGKNAEEREAVLNAWCRDEIAAVREAEREEAHAKLVLELMHDKIARMRMLVSVFVSLNEASRLEGPAA